MPEATHLRLVGGGGHQPLPAPETIEAVATPAWVQTARSPLKAILDGDSAADVTTCVWPTGQRSDAAQRAGRYDPDTRKHPKRLLPAVAARLVEQYSEPGQTVLALFCGSGTAVVEAVYAGRDAVGIDNDHRWVDVAQAHIAYAAAHGATGHAQVTRADAREIPFVHRTLRRRADLLIATPPVRLTPATMTRRDRSNEDLIDWLTADLCHVLRDCLPLLRPGATITMVTRPTRHGGHLLDLTWPTHAAAASAGLDHEQRVATLRVPLRDGRLRPHPQHWRRRVAPPVVHDDALVYRTPSRWRQWLRG
jgi:modification methylase